MKLNVFQRVSALIIAGLVASATQAQTADVPAGISGTYSLTYGFAQSSSPFTNGTVKTFVINGTDDTLCVDGAVLSGYTRSGSSEIFFDGGGGIFYALSVRPDGTFNELNVNSPTDAGSNWKGQFGGSRTSTSTACATATPTLTAEQEAIISLAAGLYPDLFESHGDVMSAQGYTYITFTSGVTVGFKDGSLYVAGGPFGSAILNKGTISQVSASLTNLKNSVSITPTADMTSLFTLAAQAYPSLFTNGTSFQTSADGYLYKYFDSGLYAAIKDGAVYVKGGSYGNVYTSVGALNAVLAALDTKINGGGIVLPEGDFNLVASGTVAIAGFSTPFSFSLNDTPAPDVSDQDEIREAFLQSLDTSGVTINSFSYTVVESSANRVEYNVSAAATVSGLSYSYLLNYVYTKQ